MAGELGLEPRMTVLETVVITISLFPYGRLQAVGYEKASGM